MDRTRRTSDLMISVCLIALIVSQVTCAPSQQTHNQPITGSGAGLHSIIVELENALYKLKELSNALQVPSNRDAAMLGDAEPEFDLSDLERLSHDQSSRAKPSQPIVDNSHDMSIEEALQYLMDLAKERKLQRRDHDIPFPLSNKENQ